MTKKKRGDGIIGTLNRKYDLQTARITGECSIEMRGRGSLAVGGCRGIVAYSPESVCLRLKKDFVTVTGEKLLCDSYTGGEVLVSGRIDCIAFRGTEGDL